MKQIARLVAVVVMAMTAAGCIPQLMEPPGPPPPIPYGAATERQVEKALQRYSAMIATMDAAGVASIYAPDGVWERQAGMIQGRDAIRNAVASLPARVLSNTMTTSSMSYNGPTVIQSGEFIQSARLPDGKVVAAQGRFEATWIRGPDGEWWIHRMVTRPGK